MNATIEKTMNLSLAEIAKKKGISYSWTIRKMRNQKPSSPGRPHKYSQESVEKAFAKKEIVEPVDVRKFDCVSYSECLMSAAVLNLEVMDCGWCQKYKCERD